MFQVIANTGILYAGDSLSDALRRLQACFGEACLTYNGQTIKRN